MKKIWLTRNLVLLTIISLAQDAASELLYPLLPYIITAGVIGSAPIALGLIEGCAEAAAGFTKLWAGDKSDTAGRKRFVVAGYTLAGIGKAFVVFASVWGAVFTGRIIDRIGKGIRSTPRDALINDSVDKEHLGKAFGFHRTGDNIGAVIGPLIALGGLALFNDDVRAVAKWALIPAFLSGFLTIFIKETIKEKRKSRDLVPKVKLPDNLKKPIATLVLIQLTNIPDALLLLRLYDLGFSIQAVVITYALYSLVTVVCAYPAGLLTDRFSPQHVYATGLIAFAIAYATLGLSNNHAVAVIAMIVYGIFPALTDGVGKAWIAKLSDDQHRGRAQGVYQASMNFAVLGAGIWGGAFWMSGTTEPVLVIAAVGALFGSAFFWIRIALERLAHRS
jgi:MFS family permease